MKLSQDICVPKSCSNKQTGLCLLDVYSGYLWCDHRCPRDRIYPGKNVTKLHGLGQCNNHCQQMMIVKMIATLPVPWTLRRLVLTCLWSTWCPSCSPCASTETLPDAHQAQPELLVISRDWAFELTKVKYYSSKDLLTSNPVQGHLRSHVVVQSPMAVVLHHLGWWG